MRAARGVKSAADSPPSIPALPYGSATEDPPVSSMEEDIEGNLQKVKGWAEEQSAAK